MKLYKKQRAYTAASASASAAMATTTATAAETPALTRHTTFNNGRSL